MREKQGGPMPVGKGRKPAPPGYITAARAGELLGQSNLYKYTKAGRLHKHVPPGKTHGYYSEEEVNGIIEADKSFFEEKLHKISARFVQARPSDMHSLRELAVRMFGPNTISEEKRRALVEKEPRGNYLLKREGTNEVIAYFYVQSLTHERIMQYMRECRGSTLTPDDIQKIEPGQHEMIIAGIGRDPRADRQYMAVMLHGFARELAQWGREGIDITRFYAYSETLEGVMLCFKMGMQLWEQPRYIQGAPHFKFVLDIQASENPLLRGYKQALAEHKQAQEQKPKRERRKQKPTDEPTPQLPDQTLWGNNL
jgi:hypothetical protein